MSMGTPWTTKHRPKTLKDIAGNEKARDQFRTWLESWHKGPREKKAALLYGPAGTGKTVTVEAVAHDLGFDLIEVNASDHRNDASLNKIAGSAATERDLFGRNKIILLDEIDGINLREDQGAISAVIGMIAVTGSPIVMTANDIWNPRISSLRSRCLPIEFKRLGVRESVQYLEKLCQAEGIEADVSALRAIYDHNKGDMRSIINDLQTALAGKKKLTLNDLEWLGWRDRQEAIFNALGTIFSSRNVLKSVRAMDTVDMDYKMLYEWIYENAPLQLTDKTDLLHAIDSLARADIYFARINKSQAWRLLPYALDMMTGGVSTSRVRTKPSWTPMRFPQRIMKLSSTRGIREMRNTIGAKIGSSIHASVRTSVSDVLPYLRIIFESNSEMANGIADYLKLDDEMITFLRGQESKEKKSIPRSKKTVSKDRKPRRRKASSL